LSREETSARRSSRRQYLGGIVENSSNSFCISRRINGANAPNGSSMSKISGSTARARELDALLHAAAKGARRNIGPFAQTDQVQRFQRAVTTLTSPHTPHLEPIQRWGVAGDEAEGGREDQVPRGVGSDARLEDRFIFG
jgi:hypothetical protein